MPEILAMATPARVDILCFRYPLKQPMQTVFGTVTSRPALILKLTDSDGASGWGEIWCNFPQPGAEYRAALAAQVLPNALAGLDASAFATAFKVVRARLHHLVLQAGEPGPADQIASGVDIALHDLEARRRGIPLAKLLGGSLRPLKAYASGIDGREAEAMIGPAQAAGYRAFKLRIGFRGHVAGEAVRAAYRVLKAGELLMVDANQNWTAEDAAAAVAELASHDLAWIEEPICVDRPLAEWQVVRKAAGRTPLAGGENMRSAGEFEAAIAGDIFDVIQPDIAKWGGLSVCAEVARRAIAAGKRYCPHYLGGGIGLVASAHLLSAVGGDGLLEVDVNDNRLRDALAGDLLDLRGGVVNLPSGAGLGHEPDLVAVRDLLTVSYTVNASSA
jgi:L-alanine-DL-glutamate epimerase-like enolase superfamily enzyme